MSNIKDGLITRVKLIANELETISNSIIEMTDDLGDIWERDKESPILRDLIDSRRDNDLLKERLTSIVTRFDLVVATAERDDESNISWFAYNMADRLKEILGRD